ncbi:YdcF family protein [Miniphocaeibacter massiliensis]|uniref:YdcF family protein n=1 Tax=Miniphocaeibacter massiliensis TaxID=2041841 RepID=UPI000C1C4557|nr:YdcF family protein [Miniphocaeibacter massiliensis]
MEDKSIFYYILGISIAILIIFILSYKQDRTRLINGVIFNVFLMFTSLTIIAATQIFKSIIINIVAVFIFIVVSLIFVLGFYILMFGCLINARIVFKRERHSLSNMLTLFMGLLLLVLYIISIFNIDRIHPIVVYLSGYITLILIYFILSFFNYLLSSILYVLYRPKYDKDYIIVLGSGLINGDEVSKLLGGRIDKAIDFYNKQKIKGKNSKIIFSGGQGKDETISEALAMQKYAINKGVNKIDTILEDKSTNTIDNFKFSKEKMDKLGIEDYKSVFSTSSYHVFRAAIYAKKIGLKITGIGAKTAFYYLPNAMIREYIAIIFMKKKSYIIKISLLTILFMFLVIINYLNSKYLK